VLDRHQPLLDLAPRRQEDPAVVLHEPVGVPVAAVERPEVPEVPDPGGQERHASLRAGRHDVPLLAVPVDDVLETVAHADPQSLEVGVRLVGQHLREHRTGRGHGQRVAVERADLLVVAADDELHDLAAADRGRRQATAHRLGHADQVGGDAEEA
jgi:hypothetical protein